MADLVRSTMEAMIPDLLILMKKKVFTKTEVKEILETREAFEYTFLRKTSSKKDYLKAIEYEYQLEQKRRERFKTLKLKKQTRRDFSIIKRIIFIFDRLTNKFQQDIALWKEYCLFCYKIKANKMFFKAVSNALSVNWESLDIWLLAVYYHVEINKDFFKARKTILQAIKMNSKRKDFWLEYFRFELNFLEKIKKRKNLLGMEEEEPKEQEEEEEGLQMFDDENGNMEIEKPKESKSKSGIKKSKEKGLSNDEFVSLGDNGLKSDESDEIAIIVYESAMEKFPDDPTINSELLQICNEFKGEWIENIKGQIFKTAVAQFGANPIANLQSFLGMRSLNKDAFENDEEDILFGKINKVFEDIHAYFQTLDNSDKGKEQISKDKSNLIEELINKITLYFNQLVQDRNVRKEVFLAAFSTILKNIHLNQLSNDKLINIFEAVGQFVSHSGLMSDEIKHLALYVFKLPNADYRVYNKLAEIDLILHDQVLIGKELLASSIRKYLTAKKSEVPQSFQASLFTHLFKLENIILNKDQIITFLKESIKYLCFTQGFAGFVEKFTRDIILAYPVTEPIVSKVLLVLFGLRTSCPAVVSFIYIDKLAEIKPSNPEIKKHLQKAVEWHPADKNLWLRYIEWEKKYGNALICPELFQKAQRTVKDGAFIHEYTNLLTN